MPSDAVAQSDRGVSPSAVAERLLAVRGLTVGFPAGAGTAVVVRGISFEVGASEFVGLVGESGSGKTLTALALLRLVPRPGRITAGSVLLDGRDLLSLSRKEMSGIRGRRIGMVFQEPMTALNPVFTVGSQIAEAVRAHSGLSKRQARARAENLLELVAMPEPRRRLEDYPDHLSGGQRQRVMIAMALASEPDLLLADEPTTALDVTVKAQILELLEKLRQELGLAVLLITHDLAVVAETCDRVVVMYAGDVVEEADATSLFESPAHPYTRALLSALPRLAGSGTKCRRLATIPGQIPEAADRPPGCSFHPRCADVMERCRHEPPAEYPAPNGRVVRCFLYDEGRR